MATFERDYRSALVGGCAIIAIAAMVALAPRPVAAQFICGGSATGAEPQAGGGAAAVGSVNNFACGTNANASGTGIGHGNSAIGTRANASGDGSNNLAVGFFADASGNGSSNVAAGLGAMASGANSGNSAYGTGANAVGDGSFNTATGVGADARGNGSSNIATGNHTVASGDGSSNIAIGNNANATGAGTNNVAIGANSVATGANATAIGNAASATFANSAAFGNGATATRANQQVFGAASNTYTMGGITSAASKAAQSGPVQVVTSDSGGNLATSTLAGLGLASSADINSINAQLAGINSHLNDLDGRVNRVGALGAALSGLHPNPRAKGDNHISAAFGAYRGQPAFAGGYFRNIDNQTLFSAGVSTTGKDWSANTGLTFSW